MNQNQSKPAEKPPILACDEAALCLACNDKIEPFHEFHVDNPRSQPTHWPECPPRWTPELIDGEGDDHAGPQEQLTFPLLGAVS
jgi:hypothetical protein